MTKLVTLMPLPFGSWLVQVDRDLREANGDTADSGHGEARLRAHLALTEETEESSVSQQKPD